MLKRTALLATMLFSMVSVGCSSQDIPQAHKGRMFDKTGVLALYSGGHGFEGPILGPGTYYTGIYPEIRMVDCGQRTIKEPLTALTKDSVQFSLDIYVRFSANCDEDKAVEKMLSMLSPSNLAPAPAPDPKAPQADTKHDVDADPIEPFPSVTITSHQVYATYVRPALGEAVREAVSVYIANEINGKRDEMFQKIKDRFNEYLVKAATPGDPKPVIINSLNLSNLDFPDQLEKANVDRATQAVLKDKAIAERERVTAEIETAQMRKKLSEAEAQQDVARIDAVGAAYHRNPEYVTIEALHYAGDKGNMILLPANGVNTVIQLPGKK